jgi:hypothetical protein
MEVVESHSTLTKTVWIYHGSDLASICSTQIKDESQ